LFRQGDRKCGGLRQILASVVGKPRLAQGFSRPIRPFIVRLLNSCAVLPCLCASVTMIGVPYCSKQCNSFFICARLSIGARKTAKGKIILLNYSFLPLTGTSACLQCPHEQVKRVHHCSGTPGLAHGLRGGGSNGVLLQERPYSDRRWCLARQEVPQAEVSHLGSRSGGVHDAAGRWIEMKISIELQGTDESCGCTIRPITTNKGASSDQTDNA